MLLEPPGKFLVTNISLFQPSLEVAASFIGRFLFPIDQRLTLRGRLWPWLSSCGNRIRYRRDNADKFFSSFRRFYCDRIIYSSYFFSNIRTFGNDAIIYTVNSLNYVNSKPDHNDSNVGYREDHHHRQESSTIQLAVVLDACARNRHRHYS
jgi:hypothetical protein